MSDPAATVLAEPPEPTHEGFDVFLSYSSKDSSIATALRDGLVEAGLVVWFDKTCIPTGAVFPRAIDDGLKRSRHILLLVSESWLASPWAALEYHGKLVDDPDSRKRTVLPVVLGHVPELPLLLRPLHNISMKDKRDVDRVVEILVRDIAPAPPSGTPAPVRPRSWPPRRRRRLAFALYLGSAALFGARLVYDRFFAPDEPSLTTLAPMDPGAILAPVPVAPSGSASVAPLDPPPKTRTLPPQPTTAPSAVASAIAATSGPASCGGSVCTLSLPSGTLPPSTSRVCLQPGSFVEDLKGTPATCSIQERGDRTMTCARLDKVAHIPLPSPITWRTCP